MIRISLPGRPLDINAISMNSHWQISKERKQWREAAAEVAKYTRVGRAERPVFIHVRQTCTGRLPDPGSIFNACKGAIDGLRDVGTLVDDSPKYVRGLWFHAAVKGPKDMVTLELVEEDPPEDDP